MPDISSLSSSIGHRFEQRWKICGKWLSRRSRERKQRSVTHGSWYDEKLILDSTPNSDSLFQLLAITLRNHVETCPIKVQAQLLPTLRAIIDDASVPENAAWAMKCVTYLAAASEARRYIVSISTASMSNDVSI